MELETRRERRSWVVDQLLVNGAITIDGTNEEGFRTVDEQGERSSKRLKKPSPSASPLPAQDTADQ